jgi:hypothetical protein
MSIETVRPRLKTIFEGVTGLTTVLTGVPRGSAAVNLPILLILTGRMVRQRLDADTIIETRNYRLVLLVKAWAAGIDLEAEDLCEPFFTRIPAAIDPRPGLHTTTNADPLATVQEARLTEDSGIIGIEFGGKDYAGAEWILEVDEYVMLSQGS